ncbi:hypothetical protein ACIBH1_18995 [Nonomuraea sp. NPDC050663]|uniref:hypothetical protein n=1 Tax=Nonomuraea sp. NPDC050663 TaxID=3364370 RepID=UPI00179EDD28|nr:hypothetical protein [Thermoactinospora sp.]
MTGVSELMGQCVWDQHGVLVGHIVDVRLVKNKEAATPALMGLVVSTNRAPWLYGLTRERNGWFSDVLAKIVYARSIFVPWESVSEYGEGEVHIKASRKDLSRI